MRAATGLFPKIKDCNRIDFNAPANTSLEQCLRFRLTSTWVYLPFACSEKVPKSLGGFIVIRYDYDWKRIIRETLCVCDDTTLRLLQTWLYDKRETPARYHELFDSLEEVPSSLKVLKYQTNRKWLAESAGLPIQLRLWTRMWLLVVKDNQRG